MRIGFIGLGRMGLPVAANIAAAGHHVQVTDIRLALVDQARTVGLSWQPSAAEAADGADVLITMLPGPDECRTAMLGDNGALAALTTGAVWIDLTSNSPQVGAHIAALAAGRGVQVLDAPVGGDPAAATAGTLTLFAGGDAQLLESQRPLLAGIADRIWHCGPAGAGYLTKMLVNEMWFAHARRHGRSHAAGRTERPGPGCAADDPGPERRVQRLRGETPAGADGRRLPPHVPNRPRRPGTANGIGPGPRTGSVGPGGRRSPGGPPRRAATFRIGRRRTTGGGPARRASRAAHPARPPLTRPSGRARRSS